MGLVHLIKPRIAPRLLFMSSYDVFDYLNRDFSDVSTLMGSGSGSLFSCISVGILGISKRLGHDSVKTTLDTYSHLYSTADDDIAQLLSETQKRPG